MSSLNIKQKKELLTQCIAVLEHGPSLEGHAKHCFKPWLDDQIRKGVKPDKLDMDAFYDTVHKDALKYDNPFNEYIDRLDELSEKLSEKPSKDPSKNKK
jgi:hypothetical protein